MVKLKIRYKALQISKELETIHFKLVFPNSINLENNMQLHEKICEKTMYHVKISILNGLEESDFPPVHCYSMSKVKGVCYQRTF